MNSTFIVKTRRGVKEIMQQKAKPNPHSAWLRWLVWFQNHRIRGEKRSYEQKMEHGGTHRVTVSSKLLIRKWERAVRRGEARRV